MMDSIVAAMFCLSCLVIIMFFVGVYVGAEKAKEKARLQYSECESGIIISLERMLRERMGQIRAGQKGIARLHKKIKKLKSFLKKLQETQQNEGDTDEPTP